MKQHREWLSGNPSFFFSVSLSATGRTEKQQKDARRCMEDFLNETQWHPARAETFAGALKYRSYNILIRWIMKRIAANEGGDTDTTRDYEYTDWESVETFARDCVNRLKSLG